MCDTIAISSFAVFSLDACTLFQIFVEHICSKPARVSIKTVNITYNNKNEIICKFQLMSIANKKRQAPHRRLSLKWMKHQLGNYVMSSDCLYIW